MDFRHQGAVIQRKQNHTANNMWKGTEAARRAPSKTRQNCRKHHLLLQHPFMLSWSYD